MTQTTVVPTDQPQFPWAHGDELDAVPLNNQFITQQNQITNQAGQITALQNQVATGNLNFSMTLNWGGNSTPSAGPYELMGSAPYDFTVVSIDASVGDAMGQFDFTLLSNGGSILSLTGITVSRFAKTNFLANPPASITQGSELKLQISNIIGFPENSWLCLNGSTNVVPIAILGSGVATAFGAAAAAAVGTGPSQSSAISSASGIAVVLGQMLGAAPMIGTAIGTSTASGPATWITNGHGVANADGNSTAQAGGSSSNSFAPFVMDDPIDGVLNQNPLA